MISNELIQKAIITKLRGNNSILTALGSADKVKESQWQGTSFTYPAIRIGELLQTPITNGICRTNLSLVTFRVETYSEKDSSVEAQQINGLVVNCLFDSFLYGLNGLNSHTFNMIRIDCVSSGNLIRLTESLWGCLSNFRCELHPV